MSHTMNAYLFEADRCKVTGTWFLTTVTSEGVRQHEDGLSTTQALLRVSELNTLVHLLPGTSPERIFALYSEAKPLI